MWYDYDSNGSYHVYIWADFRYKGVNERQHGEVHINDIIEIYVEMIGKLIKVKDNVKEFQVYVFEKDKMNVLTQSQTSIEANNEYSAKDGIHMYIGLTKKHEKQRLLRTMVIATLNDCLDDLLYGLSNIENNKKVSGIDFAQVLSSIVYMVWL